MINMCLHLHPSCQAARHRDAQVSETSQVSFPRKMTVLEISLYLHLRHVEGGLTRNRPKGPCKVPNKTSKQDFKKSRKSPDRDTVRLFPDSLWTTCTQSLSDSWLEEPCGGQKDRNVQVSLLASLALQGLTPQRDRDHDYTIHRNDFYIGQPKAEEGVRERGRSSLILRWSSAFARVCARLSAIRAPFQRA